MRDTPLVGSPVSHGQKQSGRAQLEVSKAARQGGSGPLEQTATASSLIGFCGTSRCCASGFAKLVAGDVENGKAPTLLWEGLEIRPDKNLDRLFTGINLDTNRIIAKVNLVASSVLSSNNGVGHYRLALMIAGDSGLPFLALGGGLGEVLRQLQGRS